MVLVNYSGKEINAKVVYYGPGLCGKTTNLEAIYGRVPDTNRGKMVSMKTRTERTLFFDFLPLNLGDLAGFQTRFLLYTVPGQVYYNATRKLVLKGVDALVFVADSQRGKMDENIESLDNLRENLREHGLDLDEIPMVLQFNKRDLPDVYTVEEMEAALNPNGKWIHREATATSGAGVFETFKAIARLLLAHLSTSMGLKSEGAAAGMVGADAAPTPEESQAVSPPPVAMPSAPEVSAPPPVTEVPAAPMASASPPPEPVAIDPEVTFPGQRIEPLPQADDPSPSLGTPESPAPAMPAAPEPIAPARAIAPASPAEISGLEVGAARFAAAESGGDADVVDPPAPNSFIQRPSVSMERPEGLEQFTPPPPIAEPESTPMSAPEPPPAMPEPTLEAPEGPSPGPQLAVVPTSPRARVVRVPVSLSAADIRDGVVIEVVVEAAAETEREARHG